MANERQGRIRQLFDAALDCPADLRQRFLADACAGDQQLLETVERFLRAHERSNGVLDTPIHERREVTADPRKPGSFIGPYKLLRELSGGGMGVVYQAVRADEVFQRVCAVKVIRAELATPWLLDRFRQERQILARLDHVNIARIVDGGSTPDDLPYFVMDFVDGPPIHQFCAQHELNPRQRLALVQQACTAVHYLHQHGVIHGDLKPPNILVGNDGAVRLVDFGIASILSAQEENGKSKALPLMTPGYASPEQLRGDPLTPGSDVYSLGVILYELLTGTKPFPAESRSRSEVLDAIGRQDPTPPSAVARKAPRAATRRGSAALTIKADLDSIVLKAMHRDPQRRYPSAAALSEDISRYLLRRPVTARKTGPIRASWMFLLRHHAMTLASLVIAVLLGALSWEGLKLYKSYETAVHLEDQVRDLETRLAEALANHEAGLGRSGGEDAPGLSLGKLTDSQLRDTRRLAEAYKTSLPEAVHIWPGMNRRRRNLIDNTGHCLHEAEPLVSQDPRAIQALATAWLWMANLQGNPRTVNLHDHQGAVGSINEARRLLRKVPNAPHELVTQVEDAAAQIESGGN